MSRWARMAASEPASERCLCWSCNTSYSRSVMRWANGVSDMATIVAAAARPVIPATVVRTERCA